VGRLLLSLPFADFVGLGDGWVEGLVGFLAEFRGGGHGCWFGVVAVAVVVVVGR